MIVPTDPAHPFAPGEESRYEPCGRHAGALSRMDYDRALDYAIDCGTCRVEIRPTEAADVRPQTQAGAA